MTLKMGRRNFLKTAAALAAISVMPPIIKKSHAYVNAKDDIDTPLLTQKRTLGKGNAAMEVSALGFGVMGMTYNRSAHPDKKQCIRLLHQAVDHGVTLFDTAIIYGPLNNELLAGEALAQNEVPETVQNHYRLLKHHASECIQCGLCEKRCPFQVAVRAKMKEAVRIFGF